MSQSFLTIQCLGHISGFSKKQIQEKWNKLKYDNPEKDPSDGLRKKLNKFGVNI